MPARMLAGRAPAWWRKAAVGVAALVPFAALLAYLAATTAPPPAASPELPVAQPAPPLTSQDQPAAPAGHSPADFDRMVSDLRAGLVRTPQNVDGWVLLGRTEASARHWDDARDAFAHAIAVRPGDPDLHLQLGEVLTLAAGGTVTPAAAQEFATAPDDPRARYYGAVALAQGGNTYAARHQLTVLAAEAPPDAPWLALVRAELSALDPPPAAEATPAATPAPAAAPGPTPVAEQAPIAHLQARIASNPDDAESWLALARAYQAAGDHGHALQILTQANERITGNLDLLLANGELLAEGMRDDALPPPFVGLMRRVAAIDPDQPDALWYLGLAAAANGDAAGAAQRWHRLAALLPASSDERAAVEKRLRLLP